MGREKKIAGGADGNVTLLHYPHILLHYPTCYYIAPHVITLPHKLLHCPTCYYIAPQVITLPHMLLHCPTSCYCPRVRERGPVERVVKEESLMSQTSKSLFDTPPQINTWARNPLVVTKAAAFFNTEFTRAPIHRRFNNNKPCKRII